MPQKMLQALARHRAGVSQSRSASGIASAHARYGTDIGTRTIRVYTSDATRLQTIASERGIRVAELVRTLMAHL